MIRGINQQQIFEDDEDYEELIKILEICKEAGGFELFAYCLMGNHIHLLMKTHTEDLGHIFKRIGARYVYWYNWKYRRIGHLFQDRFKSEPVENDKYFLTVLRYIHLNPVKAKLSDSVEGYRWSSYGEYIGDNRIVDTSFALEMTGVREFIKFHNADNNDTCLDISAKTLRMTDAEAKEVMRKICKCDSIESFLAQSLHERAVSIKKLNKAGASIRQISRISGVSKGIIEKTLNK